MPLRTRRALLFMPGDERHKIEKGAGLDVDSVIMDLEDGVALNNKETARSVTAQALLELDFGQTERLVRLNAFDSGLLLDDFSTIIRSKPDGLVIPKLETGEQVQEINQLVQQAEQEMGLSEGDIEVIGIIESAMGVVNLRDIVMNAGRLTALAFGAEDLVGSMGAIRTPDGWEGFYARSAVVTHAKAFGLQAIDTPFINLKADKALLQADIEQAVYMGYTGKFAIHPKQVSTIQETFTPSASQIDYAKRLIEEHDAHQSDGRGVFVFEGKMVDMPMVRAAESVLHRARAAGIEVG